MLSYKAKELIQSLETFMEFENNWDSYGSVRIREEAKDVAISFIKHLDDFFYPMLRDAEIFPVPTGGVQIEWETSGGYLEVELHSYDTVYTLYEINYKPAKTITEGSTDLSGAIKCVTEFYKDFYREVF